MPFGKINTKIIDELIAKGKLDAKQQKAALAELEAGRSPEEVLVKGGLIKEDDLTRARAVAYNIPFKDLAGTVISNEVINLLPREKSEQYNMIAFARDAGGISIGLVDPRDYQSMEAVEFYAEENGLKVKFFIVSPTAFRKAMRQFQILGKEVEMELESAKEKFAPKEEKLPEEDIEKVLTGAPVARIVSTIMRHAVESGASDIHIEPTDGPSRVRYRIDGVLRTALRLPKYIHSAIMSRIKVMANLKIDETRIPQDGRITDIIGGKKIDFRISTFPCSDNEKVAMRILDTSAGAPTLAGLGFSPRNVELIEKEIKSPHGMFLITGPTGSGKSTTLYAVLNMVKGENTNVVTLEDPVEYFMESVNQSQIRPEIGYTFASGLRAILRQDPNIIMVGEIRDRETAELGVHAALTGHLLFSTIHTNDALGAVPRLIDMGVEPFLLASTLNVVIAQRLARRICDNCKEVVALPKDVEDEMREELAGIPNEVLPKGVKLNGSVSAYRGKGCPRCNGTGYSGRISVAEIMRVTKEMEQIIEEGFPSEKAEAEIKNQKMIRLRQDGFLKVLLGLTTVEEVMRISQE
ncbi:MAG: GspE/PulE family protein [Patescibacteria group bacterium]|nr:GspE/PulE family protein [Patescibacteria group bacterium]